MSIYRGCIGELKKFPVSRSLLYGGSLYPGLTVYGLFLIKPMQKLMILKEPIVINNISF